MEPRQDEIDNEARRQQRELQQEPLGEILQTIQICHYSPMPAGFIKTGDSWDPTRCGNPTNIQYNVWSATRYDNRPIGTVMSVCASAPVPSGWAVVGDGWNPTNCGHPKNIQ